MQLANHPDADQNGLSSAIAEVRDRYSRAHRVEVSLDVVVLDNGTLIGPDEYGLIESRRAANAAMAKISATLNDPSMSDAQVGNWLTEVSQWPFRLKPNGLPDHSSVIGNLVRGVSLQVQQHGRTKIARLLAEVAEKNAAARQLIHVKQ